MVVLWIFMRPKESARDTDATRVQFTDPEIDHIMLLNTYAAEPEPEAGRKRWHWECFINNWSLQSADNLRR